MLTNWIQSVREETDLELFQSFWKEVQRKGGDSTETTERAGFGGKCENGRDVRISESRMSKLSTVRKGTRMNGRILE